MGGAREVVKTREKVLSSERDAAARMSAVTPNPKMEITLSYSQDSDCHRLGICQAMSGVMKRGFPQAIPIISLRFTCKLAHAPCFALIRNFY